MFWKTLNKFFCLISFSYSLLVLCSRLSWLSITFTAHIKDPAIGPSHPIREFVPSNSHLELITLNSHCNSKYNHFHRSNLFTTAVHNGSEFFSRQMRHWQQKQRHTHSKTFKHTEKETGGARQEWSEIAEQTWVQRRDGDTRRRSGIATALTLLWLVSVDVFQSSRWLLVASTF